MPAGGYIILKGFRGDFRGYQLTSIRMEDAAPIMKWRNEQISALRQTKGKLGSSRPSVICFCFLFD